MAMEVSYGGGPGGVGNDLYGRPAFVFRVHQVLSFSTSPVFDPSNTDRELVHVRLQVGFIVYGGPDGLIVPPGQNDVKFNIVGGFPGGFQAIPVVVGGGPQAGGVGITTAGRGGPGGLPAGLGQVQIPPRINFAGENIPPSGLFLKISDMCEILTTPRLPLRVTVNDYPWIISPQPVAGAAGNAGTYYATDARNGPTPVRPVLSRFQGTKACYCVWEVETHLQKPAGYQHTSPADQPIVLSHRWSEEQVVDDMHFTTRTISGRVVFARNVLTRQGWQPDDFRNFLLRAIPDGTVRTLVRSKVDSSGTSCDYTTVERTAAENLGINSEILSFECSIRKGFATAPGILSIPNYHADMNLTLRGRPQTSRQTLVRAAQQAAQVFGLASVASDRWGVFARKAGLAVFAPGSSPCYRFEQTVNMARREVSVSAGFVAGKDLLSDFVNFLFNNNQIPDLGFRETLVPITAFAVPKGDNSFTNNPAPRLGGGFSDVYFGRMLVQTPNDTSPSGAISAPPARMDPLGPVADPQRQPSLDPLAAANEQVQ